MPDLCNVRLLQVSYGMIALLSCLQSPVWGIRLQTHPFQPQPPPARPTSISFQVHLSNACQVVLTCFSLGTCHLEFVPCFPPLTKLILTYPPGFQLNVFPLGHMLVPLNLSGIPFAHPIVPCTKYLTSGDIVITLFAFH